MADGAAHTSMLISHMCQLRLFLVSRYEIDGSYIAVPAGVINAMETRKELAELPRLICELACRQVSLIKAALPGSPQDAPALRAPFFRPFTGYKSGVSSGSRSLNVGGACRIRLAIPLICLQPFPPWHPQRGRRLPRSRGLNCIKLCLPCLANAEPLLDCFAADPFAVSVERQRVAQ